MTRIFFSETPAILSPPATMAERKMQSTVPQRNIKDRVQKSTGLRLLEEMISAFNFQNSLNLSMILKSKNGKPYFPHSLHFNLSYSDGMVVCAGSDAGEVGVDVEKIAPVDLSLYPAYFTAEEWKFIGRDIHNFFYCWTRKEAVIKLTGEGFTLPLDSFSVVGESLHLNGELITLSSVDVGMGYMCHVAQLPKKNVWG